MTDARYPIIRGTLAALILKSLSWGPLHGYAIARWVRHRTSDVLRVEEGVLYPALHRLERDGLLRADWGKNDTGRRAKFYHVLPAGRKQLALEGDHWREFSKAVNLVLGVSQG